MLKNKNVLLILASVFFLVVATIYILGEQKTKKASSLNMKTVNISINQFIDHPNLDQVIEGFKASLIDWENNNNIKITYDIKNASKDSRTMLSIVQNNNRGNSDLILTLTTPSAQATAKGIKGKPIIFAAITDPIHAGLVKSLESPHERNITGVTDSAPYEQQFKLFKKVFPDARTIGVLHNPGEANSEASMKLIRKIAKENTFELKEVPVSNINDVILATKSFINDIDLLYLPADNTVVSSIAAIAKVAKGKKVPLLASDEGSVKDGALFTLGVNYYSSGVEAAKKAISILEGTNASTINVTKSESVRLIVNSKSFEEYGIAIPKSFNKYIDNIVYYK
jgi:putative ABC transport system substrate-binding protein